MDFSKFDQQVDTAKLAADAAEAAQNGGGYAAVPNGEYTVKIDKLEIGETKDGRPMLKGQFRILEGAHAKACLFYNRVLFGTKNDAAMIGAAISFLKSLEAMDQDGHPILVEFQSYSQFNDLVMDIAEAIDADELEYVVAYDEKAFNNIVEAEVLEG